MGNFELNFACRTGDGSFRPFTRIIAAEDATTAGHIGHAMVGEEVALGQRIECLLDLKPTDRGVMMAEHTLPYATIWGRVLEMLHVDPATVKFVYTYRIGITQNPRGHIVHYPADFEEPEICGFFVWPFVN